MSIMHVYANCDFYFTGILKLNVATIHEVLGACDFLLLSDGKHYCTEYMLFILKSAGAANQVLGIRRSAQLYSLTSVLKLCNKVCTCMCFKLPLIEFHK